MIRRLHGADGRSDRDEARGGSHLPGLQAEFNMIPHLRGTLSMARAAKVKDSANSQFFIIASAAFLARPPLPRSGRVVSGMQYVDAIHKGEPPEVMSRMVRGVGCGQKTKPMPPASMLTETAPAPVARAPK